MTTARVTALLLATLACGDDDGDGPPDVDASPAGADAADLSDGAGVTCGVNGAAEIEGTVAGQELDPVVTAFTTPVGSALAIVIDEQGDACGFDQGPGQRLVLAFCDAALPAGDYSIIPPENFPSACPGGLIAATVLEDSATGGDLEEGVSGTVTIDASAPCVVGTFQATYGDDGVLSGTFAAITCGD